MNKNNRRKVVKKDERIWVRIPWYGRALIWWMVGTAVGLVLFHAVDASAAWRCSQLIDQAQEFDEFFLSESEKKMCESVGEIIQARYPEQLLKEIQESRNTDVVDDTRETVAPEGFMFQQYLLKKDMAYVELRDALKVICACESTGRPDAAPRHYADQNNTEVLRGRITPRDTGLCQINLDYHEDAATSMGLDVHDPHDNVAYANWLYDTQGTQPWSASRKCWEGHI